jgi:hypothetical protein
MSRPTVIEPNKGAPKDEDDQMDVDAPPPALANDHNKPDLSERLARACEACNIPQLTLTDLRAANDDNDM